MAPTYIPQPPRKAGNTNRLIVGISLIVIAIVVLAIFGFTAWNEMKPDFDAIGNGTWDDQGTDGIWSRAAHIGLWSMVFLFPAVFIFLGVRRLAFGQ